VIAERVIRTIKGRIARFLTANNTHRYIDNIQQIAAGYNKSKHRTIGMAPKDVTVYHEDIIKRRMYPGWVARPGVFQKGDLVRLAKERGPFQKGYAPGWTEEVFNVHEVLQRNPPVYKMKDYLGEILEGTFYEQEIQKVVKSPHDLYKVERIMDERQSGNGTEYLIKWLGYPESMATWEPDSNIQLL
jgi:hypothetical protein